MTSKHTPGPWDFGNTHRDDQKLILSKGGKGKYICTVQIHQTPRAFGAHEEPERDANARLIAAAPELFAALDRIQNYVVTDVVESCNGNKCRESWCAGCFSSAEETVAEARDALDAARAAIAKATGET